VSVYKGRIIDVDVHHSWASDAELVEYLPEHWREFVATAGPGSTLSHPGAMNFTLHGGSNKRLDSFPPSGRPPAADYNWTCRQVLDPLNVERALLTFDVGMQSGMTNPYLSVALCRAANDWSLDHWLDGRDDRLRGTILVPTELPHEAAKEIRRLAGHPRLAAVLLVVNAIGRPFGHPFYDPIYEAAVEVGLPVASHVGSDLAARGRQTAGGNPGSRLEQFVTNDQGGMHHASSLITHGVFEKFPELKFLLTEWGFTWVPWLLWNLDAQFDVLRRENPVVRSLPSETFREHVFLSTQPFDHTGDPRQMIELLEAFGGMEDILVFATDYPHWDGDEPTHVAARMPPGWHRKVFHDNAARLFGWGSLVDEATVGAA
jgi:predicted TIM-barrel fold metal-dependent hydrolase